MPGGGVGEVACGGVEGSEFDGTGAWVGIGGEAEGEDGFEVGVVDAVDGADLVFFVLLGGPGSDGAPGSDFDEGFSDFLEAEGEELVEGPDVGEHGYGKARG